VPHGGREVPPVQGQLAQRQLPPGAVRRSLGGFLQGVQVTRFVTAEEEQIG
jgi:hypothetical protein